MWIVEIVRGRNYLLCKVLRDFDDNMIIFKCL